VACFDSYNIPGAGAGTAKCSPYGDLTWDLRNPDLMLFWKAFVECQRYGLDARSLSNTIAWLMELSEKGIITSRDTDGMDMTWGSPEVILSMARKISYREGIGDLLADGLPAAARKIGKGAEDYLLIAKGSPSDMHIIPLKTLMLGSAVSAIGEDAQVQPFLDGVASRRYAKEKDKANFEEVVKRYKDRAEREVGIRDAADPRVTDGKAALVRKDEERTDLADITGICTWMTSFIGLPVNAGVLADFMAMGLGKVFTADTLIEAGLRMHQLERAFNCRCGLTRLDDRVSKAYYDRLRPEGKLMPEISATEAELEKMKDDYYQIMGWDLQTGIPTRSTLEKHKLADAADELGL
jgi:aldehyde:ferredoxin oxidoreductase